MGLVLLILLVLLLIGSAPVYPYSMGWGFAPSGIVGFFLLAVLTLLLLRVIPWVGLSSLPR